MRFAALLLLIATPALADEQIAVRRTALWPATVEVHALVGGEFHGVRGSPVAMGVGGEALWKGRLGGFAELLATEGTSLITPQGTDGLADRISLALGFAARPFAHLVETQSSWWQRAVASIGLQIGVSMEHLRSPIDPSCMACTFEATQPAFHFGIAVELPVWRGPLDGGVALRLAARLIETTATTLALDPSKPRETQKPISEPGTVGQLFAGLVWYP